MSDESNANTIMNTVGIVVLENGILKFKRFGAALKRKIKLGTAAFANLVNNLATTEEGFAMDARVGPVIDQRFSDLEEDVESLNSAINFELLKTTTTGTTNAGGNITLNTTGLEGEIYPLSVFCEGGFGALAYRVTNNNWGCKVIDNTSTISLLVNTNVTIYCLWIHLK